MSVDLKKALRSELRRRLVGVDAATRLRASDLAARRVLALEVYRLASTVMLFVPFRTEIDTLPIAQDAWNAGKRVVVPRAHMEDRSMECVVVRNFDDDMQQTPIGVLEPRGGVCVPPSEIDLVVTPGLGFGPAGERIGHGAGFYDRFLKDRATRAVHCGYAYEVQVIEGIPMETHDARLHMLVTEQLVREFVKRSGV